MNATEVMMMRDIGSDIQNRPVSIDQVISRLGAALVCACDEVIRLQEQVMFLERELEEGR